MKHYLWTILATFCLIFAWMAVGTSGCSSAPTAPLPQDPKLMVPVQAALNRRSRDIQNCYDAEPGNKKNKPTGVIMLRFAIAAADGKLIGAAIQGLGTTLDEPRVATCLLDVVVSTKFPRSLSKDGQDLQVLYAFEFPPKGARHL